MKIKTEDALFYKEDVLQTLKYLDEDSDFLLETSQQISSLAYRLHTCITDIDLQELVCLVKNSKIKERVRIYTDSYEDDIKTHYEHYLNLLLSDAARIMYGCMFIASKKDFK